MHKTRETERVGASTEISAKGIGRMSSEEKIKPSVQSSTILDTKDVEISQK